MKGLERYVNQTLDGKYRLERLLGQGGMGAVFVATHLGTERFVALKLIAPEFMRNEEFVERFKREARAAGRLRHPNVVDVTDFGFAQVGPERVAYLVMEYLDGCTLGDVLAEEKRLPLYWVVDILEQVCSAVHEAHQQGIVHRDLKPDNIWLEPNRLGSYRVKVLDFGIAKLAEGNETPHDGPAWALTISDVTPAASRIPGGRAQVNLESETLISGDGHPANIHREQKSSQFDAAESATIRFDAAPALDAQETRLFVDSPASLPVRSGLTSSAPGRPELAEPDQTRLLEQATQGMNAQRTAPGKTTASTEGLTRVGAIMGTPAYMSPEQCRGERLDSRSDIYSLGVIAYQMLAGTPPFEGDVTTVMREHCERQPRDLRAQNPKLRKRAARVIMSALAKDPAERPQTAAALANSLLANAEGLGALYRRAFALYSEYFPKFVKLSLLAHIPVIILAVLFIVLEFSESRMSHVAFLCAAVGLGLVQLVANFLTGSIISGVTTLIVTQLAVAPLKPVELRSAFAVLRRRARPFLRTGIRLSLRIFLGFLLFVVPAVVIVVRYFLWAPVVLMEGLEKKEARKRARALASRSWRSIIFVTMVQFLVPALIGAAIGALTGSRHQTKPSNGVKVTAHLASLVNIFILPLMAIVPALLYLKMRQLGGETLNDVVAKIEEDETAHSQWQQRMRTRLSLNTPHRYSNPDRTT